MTLIIKTLVVKIASRCNLNCSYCYVYNQGDLSYKTQPAIMSAQVVDAIIEKAARHCLENKLDEFVFSFHGGEPMLAGPDFFVNFVHKVNKQFASLPTQCRFAMQSNGTLIDQAWSQLLAELQIQAGISLDGQQQVNDKYRIYHSGKGSYQQVINGLNILQQNQFHRQHTGLLTVADIKADPAATYLHLKQLKVALLDFLLPYLHYDNYPGPVSENTTLYADWLTVLFDLWYYDKDPAKPDIRMFTGFIQAILGGEYPNDLYGSYFNGLLVIETDGTIEAVDYLKTCGNAFTKTNLNILSHELSDAAADPLINLYYHCHQKLHRRCLRCPVREICGGGGLSTRFSHKNGFNNPSLYCLDLLKIIAHIRQKIVNDINITEPTFQHIPFEVLRDYVLDKESREENKEDYSYELEKFKGI